MAKAAACKSLIVTAYPPICCFYQIWLTLSTPALQPAPVWAVAENYRCGGQPGNQGEPLQLSSKKGTSAAAPSV